MSKKETKEVMDAAQRRLNEIKQAEQELKERKSSYTVVIPEPEYTYNHRMMWTTLMNEVKTSPILELTVSRLNEIESRYTDKKGPDYSEVYKCPLCSHMNLQVGYFGKIYPEDKKAIFCGSCNFTTKPKNQSNHNAWEDLHQWLIKNGYLDDGTAMIR